MAFFGTIAIGESDIDALADIVAEVETDGGPLFPHNVGAMPAEFVASHEVEIATVVVERQSPRVDDFERKTWLTGGEVVGVLHHGSIFEDEHSVVFCDIDIIGDGFGFGTCVRITQTHRTSLARRDEREVGDDAVAALLGDDRMTTRHYALMEIRGIVATGGAGDRRRIERREIKLLRHKLHRG